MLSVLLPKRPTDDYGSGDYKASRGNRTHNGSDYACFPDSMVLAPVSGIITKLGYPYGDDLSYRYVEITNGVYRHRLFYVSPTVEVGDSIQMGDIIGGSQDISARYTDKGHMNNHIHYEIIGPDGFVDPEKFLI